MEPLRPSALLLPCLSTHPPLLPPRCPGWERGSGGGILRSVGGGRGAARKRGRGGGDPCESDYGLAGRGEAAGAGGGGGRGRGGEEEEGGCSNTGVEKRRGKTCGEAYVVPRISTSDNSYFLLSAIEQLPQSIHFLAPPPLLPPLSLFSIPLLACFTLPQPFLSDAPRPPRLSTPIQTLPTPMPSRNPSPSSTTLPPPVLLHHHP